jgi:alkylhydroperoxidase family enzyme
VSTVSLPRIAPVEPPYSPEVQADFAKLMRGAPPLLLFRTLARNPRVLQRFMAGALLDRGSIPLRSRELMILRTCARCGAAYEWGVHVAVFGARAQWTPDQLHASVHGDADDACWSAEDRLVVRLADELHETTRVSDALWEDAASHFAPEQLIELILLAGMYHSVSYLINAIGIPREAFAPGFPP